MKSDLSPESEALIRENPTYRERKLFSEIDALRALANPGLDYSELRSLLAEVRPATNWRWSRCYELFWRSPLSGRETLLKHWAIKTDESAIKGSVIDTAAILNTSDTDAVKNSPALRLMVAAVNALPLLLKEIDALRAEYDQEVISHNIEEKDLKQQIEQLNDRVARLERGSQTVTR